MAEAARGDKTFVLKRCPFEAARLHALGDLSFEKVDRAKAGLSACVDALDELSIDGARPALTALVTNARRAVDAINVGRAFAFQRPPIQDAFRAVADGLIVLARAPSAP